MLFLFLWKQILFTMKAQEISKKDILIGARKGIQKSMLLTIAHESGLTLKELCTYIKISIRSIQSKEPTQFIAPGPSERALYIVKLFKQGTAIFGSQQKFHNWLNTENAVMGGEKPASYLDTFLGIQLVLDELNAIEYGFSAW